MVIKPMIRNNICMNAHPVGCYKDVEDQIAYVKSKGSFKGPKRVLVIGGSTGYGLASRISLAFGAGAGTISVAFEKEASENKPGTMGWHNTASFDILAKKAGLVAESINGDAFSKEIKAQVIERIKTLFGQVDAIIYSLASPVRTDPETGVQYRSSIKPIGQVYTAKTYNTTTKEVTMASIEPVSSQDEVDQSVKVMGGEDWTLWIKALLEAGVVAPNCVTMAYSYIGPKLTHPVYLNGTIGTAKAHLERTVKDLDKLLAPVGGKAYVSENKGLVTRASAVIPVVPLYFALLYKIMKDKGIHENCIQQMDRLFRVKVYGTGNGTKGVPVDAEGRIRMDDWELREDVQAEVDKLWAKVDSNNIAQLADIEGTNLDFLNIHGFGKEGVDYEADVNPLFPTV
jgi:enoyl-[acyl-carrier protein] reductase/trans-2-enoyl-CoA reductase (NAD+)